MAEHFDSGPRDHKPHLRGGLVRQGDRRFLSVKRWDRKGDQKNENETEQTMDPHACPPVPHFHYRQRGRKTGMAGVRWPKRIRAWTPYAGGKSRTSIIWREAALPRDGLRSSPTPVAATTIYSIAWRRCSRPMTRPEASSRCRCWKKGA